MSTLAEVRTALEAPFPHGAMKCRVGPTWGTDEKKTGRPLPYISSRAVQDRLDEVVGPDHWSDDYEIVGQNTIKCRLTVLGVTKAGIGEAGADEGEKYKSAESDALKRAAVKFGVGRYLYDLELPPVDLERKGKTWVLPRGYKPPEPARQAPARKATEPTPRSAESPRATDPTSKLTGDQIAELREMCRERGLDTASWRKLLMQNFPGTDDEHPGPVSADELIYAQYIRLKTKILPAIAGKSPA